MNGRKVDIFLLKIEVKRAAPRPKGISSGSSLRLGREREYSRPEPYSREQRSGKKKSIFDIPVQSFSSSIKNASSEKSEVVNGHGNSRSRSHPIGRYQDKSEAIDLSARKSRT
jgi:hypothetical protein